MFWDTSHSKMLTWWNLILPNWKPFKQRQVRKPRSGYVKIRSSTLGTGQMTVVLSNLIYTSSESDTAPKFDEILCDAPQRPHAPIITLVELQVFSARYSRIYVAVNSERLLSSRIPSTRSVNSSCCEQVDSMPGVWRISIIWYLSWYPSSSFLDSPAWYRDSWLSSYEIPEKYLCGVRPSSWLSRER